MRVRDKIHGDMEFTKDEERIIRSRSFQRLQRIKQLGSTYYVYPGARHTRFDHSLGTCQMVSVICRELRRNLVKEKRGVIRPGDIDEDLIRKAALLHDIAHVPFGHMLEDELKIIESHEKRFEGYLDEEEIRKALGSQLKDVKKILTTDNPHHLDLPYQGEIISNTISADLLDYVRRDARECGLRKEYDDRILSYFKLLKHNGKAHVVIDIQEQRVRCLDVVTELEDLLRLRYVLSERVYSYHTKIQADAMIGKALAEALEKEDITKDELDDLGDDELVYLLSEKKGINAVSRHLATEFRERRLYRTIYMIDPPILNLSNETTERVAERYQGRQKARDMERKIVKEVRGLGHSLNYKDVILFCHDAQMRQKYAGALVRDEKQEIGPVQKASPEFGNIIEKHKQLWRLYVFATIDCGKAAEKALSSACKKLLGFENQWDPAARRARGLYYG